MKTIFCQLLGIGALLLASPLWSQTITVPEGWGTFELPQTPEREAALLLKLEGEQASFSANPPPPPASAVLGSNLLSLEAPDAVTPEITALAAGLENDPMRIFNWVRRNIRYVPYAGCVKGAMLTLLERSGNDFDQCTLLAALLRSGGTSVYYYLGGFYFSDTDAANYWQTHTSNVTSAKLFQSLALLKDSGRGLIQRLVVVATLPGEGDVPMDPSLREYQSRVSLTMSQLLSASGISGISSAALLNEAEGSAPPPPDQAADWQYHQLNRARFGSYLNARVNQLIGDLRTNHPNQYGDFLFTGFEETSSDIQDWSEAFPRNATAVYTYISGAAAIPASACAELDLELYSKPLDAVAANRTPYKTITLSLPSLQGRRLDLRFESSAAVLSLFSASSLISGKLS